MKARIVLSDGSMMEKTVEINNGLAALPADEIPKDCEYVDFLYDYFNADTGDEGYFVLPFGATEGIYTTEFTQREDTEFVALFSCMGCYGYFDGKIGVLGIMEGMRYDYSLVAGVKDGKYYAYPRYLIECDRPYEDISIRFLTIPGGDYSAMGRAYRAYQLKYRGCVPLEERVKQDARLKKSIDGINVRIRQGWKPVPPVIEEQTEENEPEMYAACSFDRAAELVDEFKRQGIEHTEFCLVGWNKSGHDGRFPQIFPVEPALGGEEGLRSLIKHAQEMGYTIVCHDDATAAYRIADCWDEEYILKNKDGSLYKRPKLWAGGRPYKICPQRQYERFETENMPKLRELGFEGIHYIDVMTILELLKCYDSDHPLTRAESAQWYRKIMRLARKTFGGFSSEGCYDYAAAELDYIMYASFHLDNTGKPDIADEHIPLWEIAYHGIIAYNPGTFTLNYAVKGEKNRLKFFEYGGRPLVVFYANFASNSHWMGLEDMLCRTDEQLRESVAKVKLMAEDYKALECVRFAFMDSHRQIQPGVFCTEYSNGISVTVDYNRETVEINRV